MAKKYTPVDLPDGWEAAILALYDEGASDIVIKKWIYKARGRFSNHIWEAWLRDDQTFIEVIETGRVLSQAWWETQGARLDNKAFNSTLWNINMKSRFGWTGEQKDVAPIKVELKIDFVKPK